MDRGRKQEPKKHTSLNCTGLEPALKIVTKNMEQGGFLVVIVQIYNACKTPKTWFSFDTFIKGTFHTL